MVIVTSKFLEWSIDLLREEPKLFEIEVEKDKYYKEMEKNQPHSADKFDQKNESQKNLLEGSQDHQSHLLQMAHEHQGKNKISINRGFLMRLKYKCSVTLLSLMEMQENNDEIVNRLIRSIPCSVLASEVGKLYAIYKKIYVDDYSKDAFKRVIYESLCYYQYEYEIDFEQEEKEEDQMIIEYGFNLFILSNILISKNKKGQETELEDIQEIIEKF